MSGPPAPRPGRPRYAAASAARHCSRLPELFGQRGFEGTTTREIGALAGVDPALIARYFGSKAHLYIAVVVAESGSDEPRRRPGE